ncbi:MAG: carboxypeptidase-like regulatory domain-containing protein, partial [Acidobacteriota bacterium]
MKQTARILSVLFLCFGLLGSAVALQAQEFGTLTGKVVDRNEKLPLPTVRVSIAGVKLYALTGLDGMFTIKNVPVGSHKVVFELSGYVTETLKNVQIT